MKAQFVRVVSILIVLLACPGIFAGERGAVDKLAAVEMFAFGGIGIAGTTSSGEILFREVLASSHAEADFLKVLENGTLPAKCYALVGLKAKNKAAFDERVEALAKDKTPVETAAGCVLMKLPMYSVIGQIRAGNYDDRAKSKK